MRTHPTDIGAAAPSWRHAYLIGLALLSAYSTAIAWQAQLVSYPLYRAVGPDDFLAYHAQYNHAIPGPVIAPGFATFLATVAFWWAKPHHIGRRAAAVITATGAASLATTVLWAIPRHDQLDRDGQSAATIDSLLRANTVRTAALTVATVTLGWCLHRTLQALWTAPAIPDGSVTQPRGLEMIRILPTG